MQYVRWESKCKRRGQKEGSKHMKLKQMTKVREDIVRQIKYHSCAEIPDSGSDGSRKRR